MYCLSSSLSFSPATSKTGKTISSIRPPLLEDQRGSSVTSLSATLAILRAKIEAEERSSLTRKLLHSLNI
ncbi:hypothetical protein Tco_0684289 [Tanacetum coccineum]